MNPAAKAVEREEQARLLVVTSDGRLHHAERSRLVEYLVPGDLLVANDAATLPASLHGVHCRSGAPIEVRLAGRSSLDTRRVRDFTARRSVRTHRASSAGTCCGSDP
jgi:S-adenosylmethionine:tRNA ribosyltransferase-isomerase